MTDRDNVTPLRPPPPPKPPFNVRDPQSQTLIVHGLTVAAFAIMWLGNHWVDWIGTGLGVAALAIAASRRDEGPSWLRSHFEFALRTLIIGGAIWILVALVFGVLGGVLSLVFPPLGMLAWVVQIAVLGWVSVRSVIGFMRAADQKPIANPVTWLI